MLIAIVGSGRIGSTVASNLIARGLGDILLLDIIEKLPQGEALDLGQMAASYGVDIKVTGSNHYKDMGGADIVVITAGLPRRPGMTRLDLLHKNAEIIGDVSRKVAEYAPKSKVIMVTNPLDVMTYVALKATGFSAKQVAGMSGLLDSARFRYFIAESLGVSHSSVNALVIGEHGEAMLPLLRYSTVSGRPLTEIASREVLEKIVEKTRKTAAEVIALKGGTVHAPASAVCEMVEAIVKSGSQIMPLSTYLDGEYGVKDLCIGVPAVFGRDGVEKIVELDLDEGERSVFMKGVEDLRRAVSETRLL